MIQKFEQFKLSDKLNDMIKDIKSKHIDLKLRRRTLEDSYYFYIESTVEKNEMGTNLEIAHLDIPFRDVKRKSWSAGDVYVSDKYRNKKLATWLYLEATKFLNLSPTPATNQSPDGQQFWDKFKKHTF